MHKCKYCEMIFDTQPKLSGHATWCDKNPNKAKNLESIKEKWCWGKGRKHSDESKKKMRESRLRFMKEHPEKTAWRLCKQQSFPEKVFIDQAKKREWDKKYRIIKNFPEYPYFIDYAFINEKAAIEIDGSQHQKSVAYDKKRDELLESKGWRVYRIEAQQIMFATDQVMDAIIEFVGASKTNDRCGIITHKQLKKSQNAKIERRKHLFRLFSKKQRVCEEKIVWKKMMIKKIQDLNIDPTKHGSISQIARICEVSHTTIRRLLKQ